MSSAIRSGLLLLLLAPGIASAHAYLVRSAPAQRAVLYKAPAKIQLWFNERLEARFSTFSLSDADGRPFETGKAEVPKEDSKQLSATVKPLPPGRYVVKYRVLSVDGHLVEDEFPFTIRR